MSQSPYPDELDLLVPPRMELTIAGEAISLTPLKVGQLPAFLRAITPALPHLTGPEIDWLALIGERGDDLLAAIAIAVGKPRAWVDALAADEALLLAAQVIQVNADFFTRTVMPKLNGLLASVPLGQVPAGSTPSNA